MESRMKHEQMQYLDKKMQESKRIAHSLAEVLFGMTNDVGVSVHAACILFATTCAINNIDPKMAAVLFDGLLEQINDAARAQGGPLQ